MTLSSGSSTSPLPVSTRLSSTSATIIIGFEVSEITVGAPVLGELDAGPLQLIGKALELGLEPLEQREGVGGGAGETSDDIAIADATHLLGVALDDGLAEGHLSVAGDHHLAALADGEDRRPIPGVGGGVAHCCNAISDRAGRFVKRITSLALQGGAAGAAALKSAFSNRR